MIVMNRKKNENPWTENDEKEHFPSGREWWCAEAYFTSIEDKKKWSLKMGFTQWVDHPNKVGSNYSQTLFDINENKYYRYYSSNREDKLESIEDRFDIRFEDSYLNGLYPNYEMKLSDLSNDIKLFIKYQAESLPRWVAQEATDGWMPMGLGDFRYGFIPKLKLEGSMQVQGKNYTIKGCGYYEHAWGDFSFANPFSNKTGLKKTFSTYASLLRW